MKTPYSATVSVKMQNLVIVEFARPLSPETAQKLIALQRDGISIVTPLGIPGFWFKLEEGQDVRVIAQSCLDVLYSEGFELNRVLCKNFVPNVGLYQNQALKTMAVEASFREELGKGFHLLGEGENRYRIFTPFQFRNGDHLAIVLKKLDEQWFLTDEGHTYMHLSCRISHEKLDAIMDNPFTAQSLAEMSVENREGEIMTKVVDTKYAPALYKLIHILLQIIVLSELVSS